MNPDTTLQIQPTTPPQPRGGRKYVLIIILAVLLAAGGVVGTYAWQHQKLTDSIHQNAALSAQLANAKKMQSSTNTDRITAGQVDFTRGPAGTIYIDAYLKPSMDLKEMWVEYGTSPDNLNLQTQHTTNGLAAGDNFSFAIKEASLKPGIVYFYRVVAKSTTGTEYSGTAAFTSLK